MTKIYKVNGKEISSFPCGIFDPANCVPCKINQLLEALSDKEEVKQKEQKDIGYKLERTEKGAKVICPQCGYCSEATGEYLPKPKQEECLDCYEIIGNKVGAGKLCEKHMPIYSEPKPKQSTSLKEELKREIFHHNTDIDPTEVTDKIISLLQSHILKEIQLITNLNGEIEHEDIIKIINNITK